ncbi:MAG: adenosylmethionine--8-amino-7-oxononanoate transaminase [Pirellula sp.]|nr:adenosylmethionine--8-amino-7-oxononanoate transaminase [Pirellula sp.]
MEPMNKEELLALDRRLVWHAFSQMSEYNGLIIESAEGCWLTDIDGRRILDGASSLWCNVHGHKNPTIDQAIKDQLEKVAHVTNLGMSHPVSITLAKRLVETAPHGLNHVFFCGDGASAVEVAMKIAFQYWIQTGELQRTKFLALGSAYHGDTLGTVSLGGVPRFHEMFKPILFPVLRGPCPEIRTQSKFRMYEEDPASKEFYLSQYRELLEQNKGQIAGVVVEPLMQCAAGMVMQPAGFLRGIADLCREFNTLLIVDEIAVGLGRTGRLYASQWEDVEPDLMCIGKGLTGGYLPMSATLTTSKIFEAFLGDASKTLYHGHTYGGNPLCAAAAHASLDLLMDKLSSEDFCFRLTQLQNRLKKLANHDDVASVTQLGALGAVVLKQGSPRAKAICDVALQQGVWLRPLGNCIPIVPP